MTLQSTPPQVFVVSTGSSDVAILRDMPAGLYTILLKDYEDRDPGMPNACHVPFYSNEEWLTLSGQQQAVSAQFFWTLSACPDWTPVPTLTRTPTPTPIMAYTKTPTVTPTSTRTPTPSIAGQSETIFDFGRGEKPPSFEQGEEPPGWELTPEGWQRRLIGMAVVVVDALAPSGDWRSAGWFRTDEVKGLFCGIALRDCGQGLWKAQ